MRPHAHTANAQADLRSSDLRKRNFILANFGRARGNDEILRVCGLVDTCNCHAKLRMFDEKTSRENLCLYTEHQHGMVPPRTASTHNRAPTYLCG